MWKVYFVWNMARRILFSMCVWTRDQFHFRKFAASHCMVGRDACWDAWWFGDCLHVWTGCLNYLKWLSPFIITDVTDVNQCASLVRCLETVYDDVSRSAWTTKTRRIRVQHFAVVSTNGFMVSHWLGLFSLIVVIYSN